MTKKRIEIPADEYIRENRDGLGSPSEFTKGEQQEVAIPLQVMGDGGPVVFTHKAIREDH